MDRAIDWAAWGCLLMLLLQPLAAGTLPPVTLFHSGRHLVLPLLLPVLFFALARRRLAGLPATIGVVVWIAAWPAWRVARAPPQSAADFSVLTLNLGHLRSGPDEVARVLRAVDADLVLLQEVGPHHEPPLRRQLGGLYEHQAWYPLGRRGKAVLTRFPLQRQELIEFRDGASALDATAEIAGREVRVLNVHHRSWVCFGGRLSSGVLAVETWVAERRFSDEVALVAGDFNSVPGSAVLAELEESGFTSAFSQVGDGAGFTFPIPGRYKGWPWGPTHRLDHVLHSPELEALRAEVGPDAGSDHLPVIADLRFSLRSRRDWFYQVGASLTRDVARMPLLP